MPKYWVFATATIDLSAEIEAETEEGALWKASQLEPPLIPDTSISNRWSVEDYTLDVETVGVGGIEDE